MHGILRRLCQAVRPDASALIDLHRWLDELKDRRPEPLRLTRHGFHAFSQADEDGIVLEIFNRIGVTDMRFVECGVGDGTECCTALPLLTGWSGLWFEAVPRYVRAIKRHHAAAISDGRLTVAEQFVTAENIDGAIAEWADGTPDDPAEIDLLSIDIDGNDYWVWSAIKSVSPRVVIVEYNAAYPPPLGFVRAYDPQCRWNGGSYFGASLSSLAALGQENGYALVGCSLSGVNAFFVRMDELTDAAGRPRFHAPFKPEEHFEPLRLEFGEFRRFSAPAFGENAAPFHGWQHKWGLTRALREAS